MRIWLVYQTLFTHLNSLFPACRTLTVILLSITLSHCTPRDSHNQADNAHRTVVSVNKREKAAFVECVVTTYARAYKRPT